VKLYVGDHVLPVKIRGDWVLVETISENSTRGWLPLSDVSPCPVAPPSYCNHLNRFDLLENPSNESRIVFSNVEENSRFEIISQNGDYYFVAGIVGYSAGFTGYVPKGVLSLCPLKSGTGAYNRDGARQYASNWWSSANHKCGTYTNCGPYSYWGSESCGYASHGGDCANLVSQSLVAGGHPYLTGGSEYCRGYPCGKEEIGAKKLGDCLVNRFGWRRVCGYRQTPPSGVRVGDVIVYHAGNCGSFEAHATIITSVSGSDVRVTCHSNNRLNVAYTYLADSKPYYEFLLYQGS